MDSNEGNCSCCDANQGIRVALSPSTLMSGEMKMTMIVAVIAAAEIERGVTSSIIANKMADISNKVKASTRSITSESSAHSSGLPVSFSVIPDIFPRIYSFLLSHNLVDKCVRPVI